MLQNHDKRSHSFAFKLENTLLAYHIAETDGAGIYQGSVHICVSYIIFDFNVPAASSLCKFNHILRMHLQIEKNTHLILEIL